MLSWLVWRINLNLRKVVAQGLTRTRSITRIKTWSTTCHIDWIRRLEKVIKFRNILILVVFNNHVVVSACPVTYTLKILIEVHGCCLNFTDAALKWSLLILWPLLLLQVFHDDQVSSLWVIGWRTGWRWRFEVIVAPPWWVNARV